MANRIDWPNLFLALLVGVALGVLVPLGAHALGMPGNLVGPITGGMTGGLVALVYRWRTRAGS